MGVLESCTKEQDVGKECIIPELGEIGVGICDNYSSEDGYKCKIEEAVTTCKGSTVCARCNVEMEPPSSYDSRQESEHARLDRKEQTHNEFSSSSAGKQSTTTIETVKVSTVVNAHVSRFSKSVGVCLNKALFEQDETEIKAGNYCQSAREVEIYFKTQSTFTVHVREEITSTIRTVTGGKCYSHEECGTGKYCTKDWDCEDNGRCDVEIDFGRKRPTYPIDGECPDMAAVSEFQAKLAADQIRLDARLEEAQRTFVKKCESHKECDAGKYCTKDWDCSDNGRCDLEIDSGRKRYTYPIDGICPDMAAVAEYQANLAAKKIRWEKEKLRLVEEQKRNEHHTIKQKVEVREHFETRTHASKGTMKQHSLGPRLRRR